MSKVGRNRMHFLKSENPETFIEGSNISGASQDSSKGKQMRTQWTVIVRADIVTVFYHRRWYKDKNSVNVNMDMSVDVSSHKCV